MRTTSSDCPVERFSCDNMSKTYINYIVFPEVKTEKVYNYADNENLMKSNGNLIIMKYYSVTRFLCSVGRASMQTWLASLHNRSSGF